MIKYKVCRGNSCDVIVAEGFRTLEKAKEYAVGSGLKIYTIHAYEYVSRPRTIKDQIDWENQGEWVPASGGTETPFVSRSGVRLLYVWQPRSGRHAYLNLDTDIILSDEESQSLLGW